jgi:hypothetical protein
MGQKSLPRHLDGAFDRVAGQGRLKTTGNLTVDWCNFGCLPRGQRSERVLESQNTVGRTLHLKQKIGYGYNQHAQSVAQDGGAAGCSIEQEQSNG